MMIENDFFFNLNFLDYYCNGYLSYMDLHKHIIIN